MLEIQRAASSIGSPRPSCESLVDKKMAWPPIWAMPESEDTGVRGDVFSEDTPSTLFVHNPGDWPLRCRDMSSVARWMIWLSSSREISLREKKGLGAYAGTIIAYPSTEREKRPARAL